MSKDPENITRCRWCNGKNIKYVEYHDHEWGILRKDDKYLYEMLILESFQAGLSWECVLNKREAFREAFDGFDVKKVSAYGEEKINSLMEDKNIIRNRNKILSAIKNSRIFMEISSGYGSFYDYLTSFCGNDIIFETGRTTNAISDAVSSDLKKRGMKYVGSTTIYSFLQAVGIIYSHEEGCFLNKTKQP